MTANPVPTAHPADGDLLRFSDGECAAVERNRIAAHIAACSTCAETSRLFQTTTAQLHEALEDLSVPPVPDAKERFLAARRRVARRAGPLGWVGPQRTPLLRAAVILLALFLTSLWAPPVRALFLRLLHMEPAETVEMTPPPGEAVASDAATSSTISFVPAAPSFTIDVDAVQAGGSLVIHVAASATASARLTGRSPGDALLVTESGIRIQNSGESSADYVVTVPSTVSRIMVRVAGGAATSYAPQAIMARDSVIVSLR